MKISQCSLRQSLEEAMAVIDPEVTALECLDDTYSVNISVSEGRISGKEIAKMTSKLDSAQPTPIS
jgi:hypothetical protein